MTALRRCAAVFAVMLAGLASAPGVALAHGIGGSAADLDVWEFLPLGIEHMLLGWDHLLFIGSVVLLAGELGRAAKLITVFVLGHSTTLIIATLAGWQINALAVDVVIALSVAFVGIVGWIGRPQRWTWFGTAVLGFGLIHGLGLSTRLQALGLPEDGMLARVIAFNIGIEIGQLSAIAVMVVLGKLLTRFITWTHAERATHGGFVAIGVVAALVLTTLTLTGVNNDARAETLGSCTITPRATTYSAAGGGHPAKPFYGPSENYPETDFGHVLGDGYVLVHYPTTLPDTQVAELKKLITGPDGAGMLAGAAPDQDGPLRAVTAQQQLECDEFDLPALREFTKNWHAELQGNNAN
ncbi:HupE/UreJ family protein [Haloechinothrix salitolerans]|uniref:HupE/UreJ family protein n=1 Tax=Haloechinothrix salitolerans TaxID=926830 RepID=A0ABW2C3C2_9PSEU